LTVEEPMAKDKIPPVINPTVDVGDELDFLIGDTAGVEPFMGGYRIKIYHTRAFPWDEVMKVLLFRDFKVYVTRHKADLFIEATP
jgi:hypothetical protein